MLSLELEIIQTEEKWLQLDFDIRISRDIIRRSMGKKSKKKAASKPAELHLPELVTVISAIDAGNSLYMLVFEREMPLSFNSLVTELGKVPVILEL